MRIINNFKLVKELLKPKEVAQKYLGNPNSHSGKYDFYKSPFRLEERTPSFAVSERGFYDFGTGKSYDILDFVSEYAHVKLYDALKILVKDFNLQVTINKIDEQTYKKLEKEREKKINERNNRINFFHNKFNILCNEFQSFCKVLEKIKIKEINKITDIEIEQMELRDKLDYVLDWFVNNDINLIYNTLSEYKCLDTKQFINKSFNKLMSIDLKLDLNRELEDDINKNGKEEEDEL